MTDTNRQQLLTAARALYATDADLAATLDVHVNTIGRWRRGETPISRLAELALLHLIATHTAQETHMTRVNTTLAAERQETP